MPRFSEDLLVGRHLLTLPMRDTFMTSTRLSAIAWPPPRPQPSFVVGVRAAPRAKGAEHVEFAPSLVEVEQVSRALSVLLPSGPQSSGYSVRRSVFRSECTTPSRRCATADDAVSLGGAVRCVMLKDCVFHVSSLLRMTRLCDLMGPHPFAATTTTFQR